MKKVLFYFIALSCIFPEISSAQYFNKNRYEWVFGLGATNFLGDVGGANSIGTHFIKDFNFGAIREMGSVGMRYQLSDLMAVKGGLYLAMVRGNDAFTSDKFRYNRNINFRSPIVEISSQYEIYFNKEHIGHRYHIRHAHGFKKLDLRGYAFIGIGAFFFNPQGYYNGTWYNLRPLGTEGQGLPGGPKEYSRFGLCMPVGLGCKYAINRQWSIGLEISERWTTSDYIDDTSNKYYNNDAILNAKGTVAAYFADPSLGKIPGQTNAGQERGDVTHNDTYLFAMFTANYKIVHRRRTRSKF